MVSGVGGGVVQAAKAAEPAANPVNRMKSRLVMFFFCM
jgi:hypothetical protein